MKLDDSTPCWCVIGFHFECENKPNEDECCCSGTTLKPLGITGPQKADEDIRDPKSTGRKRAVLVKSISPGDICEWAGLKFAGGMIDPIVGCMGNLAAAIHHGQQGNKSTLDNRVENLAKICDTCHNRVHSLNDKYYGEDPITADWYPDSSAGPLWPHDAETKATTMDQVQSEIWWSAKPGTRKAYREAVFNMQAAKLAEGSGWDNE